MKHTTTHKFRSFELTVFNTGNVKGSLVLSYKNLSFYYFPFAKKLCRKFKITNKK